MKFAKLLDVMKEENCDMFATGHYANVTKANDRYCIKKSNNEHKDQSYMLYRLNQEQLSHIIFPIGNMDKNDVRKIASELNLSVADKKDSQDVCFVNDISYQEFIMRYEFGDDYKERIARGELKENEILSKPYLKKGEFVDIDGKVLGFHNGIIDVLAKKNSKINITLVNLMNNNSNNFISIQNNLEEKANVNYTIVDFGGKACITNYYSNIVGKEANNTLSTIYLGKEKQNFDFNYIAELRGEKSNIDIDVIGALKENAKKHFKGTIDFKKGCKKATGNENEYCMILSDTAKSIALPMLLCSEEDVLGNHSSAAGKVGEKELFYIMSRGFTKKEALKLMVRAKFNKILDKIRNERLKEEILEEIDKRLD